MSVCKIKKSCIFAKLLGEVLEWLKRLAWKAGKRQNRFGGSNPPLSAKVFDNYFLLLTKIFFH